MMLRVNLCRFTKNFEDLMIIACLDEIGFHQDWLTNEDLANRAASLGKSSYGAYLRQLAKMSLH
jgi:dTDP-glucose pyrophosphorylase